MPWFDKSFAVDECCHYASSRIVSVRLRKKDESTVWFRGVYLAKPEHLQFLNDTFHEGKYNMYVSGFTFDWDRFNAFVEYPPPYDNRRDYSAWVERVLVPNLYKHIKTKDIVFEVDRNEGKPLSAASEFTNRIIDGLKSKGLPCHVLFSGSNGYHTIIEDGTKLFQDYGISAAPTLKGLSYGAIETAQKLLAEMIPDQAIALDEKGRGRAYNDVSVHFSPMFPQGVRKAPYSVTENGTVVLPVSKKELDKNPEPDFYKVDNVLKAFHIKGRGWNLC